MSELKARVITPDQGTPIKPFGVQMRVMLRTEETGGRFSALYTVLPPGGGPPPHLHHDRQEYLVILQGRLRVQVGSEAAREVGPGTLIFIPNGTVHTFTNVGDSDVIAMDWSIPGGHEKYFEAIDALQAGSGFDHAGMEKVNHEHATEFTANQ